MIGNEKEQSRVREMGMLGQHGEIAILSRMAKVDPTEKVISEQRLEGRKGISHVDIYGYV